MDVEVEALDKVRPVVLMVEGAVDILPTVLCDREHSGRSLVCAILVTE
jgi:hypothetical protein